MRVKVRVGPVESWIAALPESLKHEFSLEELEQMKQQFCDFDESGDGSIAATELVGLMKSMGIEATLDEVQSLIDKVDDNRSGELEYHEFVRLMSEFRRGNGDKLAVFIQYSKLALEIRRELQDLKTSPTEYSEASAIKESAWEWKVAMRGPRGSPYEGGTFHFHVTFGHEYPYEAPGFICRTRIYHPNFVPLLNGSMTLHGFMDRWQPEWRMRGLLERVEALLATPDVDLMTTFYDESMLRLGQSRAASPTQSKQRQRHPRDITLECIDAFVTDPEQFRLLATEFTTTCANGSAGRRDGVM